MSTIQRGQAAAKAKTPEIRRKANLKRQMNGTAHLNPNAERNFNSNCVSVKKIFEKVNLFGCQCRL
jgi:hypothetical protein